MNEFNSNIDDLFTDSNNNTNNNHVKLLYQELADKEQALILAAQFGKNLIEEKEDLEKQIESMKREQQNQIESLEQESYELKRLIESMRNEYEAKIYELTEDLHLVNRKLVQKDQIKQVNPHQNEQLELIQDLNEKNQKLIDDFKTIEIKLIIEQQKNEQLEEKLTEKEKILNESSIVLTNFQKEINQLANKQQDLDYMLMQTCNERDKQTKLIEELTNKYLFLKNEKNDLEHLIFQHENELFNLRRTNQELLFKYEKLESLSITVNRKRRSSNSSMKKNIYNSNFDHFYNSNNNNKKLNYNNNQFTNTAYLFDKSSLEQQTEFQDIEEDSHDLDIFKMNEIEQDDEDGDEEIYYNQFNNNNNNNNTVNWQQETIEHNLSEKRTSDDDYEEEDSNETNKVDHHEDRSLILSKNLLD